MKEVLDLYFEFFKWNSDLIWIVIPILITVVVMEFYYARHNDEEVGWNTATANSLVLIFVAMDLFRNLFSKGLLTYQIGNYGFDQTVLVSLIVFQGFFLFLLNFGHHWPKFMAFNLSSQLPINLIAYGIIIIVYKELLIDLATFQAFGLFYLTMLVFFFAIRVFYKKPI